MTKMSTRLGCTCFEDLSNEILYELFDYLDDGQVFDAFFSLNTRFQRLLTHSSLPLQLDFALIPRVAFHNRCKLIVAPHIDRLTALSFPNQLSINSIDKFFSFKPFLHLRSLIFNKVIPKKLIPILHDLASLPQLTALTVTTIDHSDEEKTMCQAIFRLPVLKYCKISLGDNRRDFPLSLSEEQVLRNSTIEYLIINGFFNIDGLVPILTHMTKLRHLSCSSLWATDRTDVQAQERIPSSLTYLSLKLDDVTFSKFKSIISRFDFQLKVLKITALFDRKYLDADRWQKLILNHMPQLCVFDYDCHCTTIIDDEQNKVFHRLVERFNSPFWTERKWFFGHRHGEIYNRTYAYIYSVKPYRKQYYFYITLDKQEQCPYKDTGINLAQSVSINTDALTDQSVIEFPNVNELNLVVSDTTYDPTILSRLTSTIPLAQITTICFSHTPVPFVLMLEILLHASNIRTLVFHNTKILDKHKLTFEQTQILSSSFEQNQIRKISIDAPFTLRHYKLLLNLCPKLKYLKMKSSPKVEGILRFLISQSSNPHSELSLLCIWNVDKTTFKQIQNVIDREKLLDDYSIDLLGNELHLWW